MTKEAEKLIKYATEWVPLVTATGKRGMRKFNNIIEEYGSTGVYQVCLERDQPTDIISDKIGYTGKATNVFRRTYGISTPNGKHTCRLYLASNNIDLTAVSIRFFLTEPEDYSRLEDIIHTETTLKHGYRFAWREASGGKDGDLVRIQEMIDKIDNIEDLKLLGRQIEDRAIDIFKNEWLKED